MLCKEFVFFLETVTCTTEYRHSPISYSAYLKLILTFSFVIHILTKFAQYALCCHWCNMQYYKKTQQRLNIVGKKEKKKI